MEWDWTKTPRSLIYEERKKFADLNIETEGSLEKTFFEKLEHRPIIMRLDDPIESVLKVFNNARYLCTLILLEKHPFLFRHIFYKIGVKDHEGDILWEYHLYPVTMALVCNYLYNYLGYSDKDDILKHYLEHLEEWGEPSPEGRDDFYKLLLLDGYTFSNTLCEKDFEPRVITHKALNEAFYSGDQTWRVFTRDYDIDAIATVFTKLGRTVEEKEDIRQSMRMDVELSCDTERKPRVLAQIDALDFSSSQTTASSGMEARYSRLLFERQSLNKEVKELKTQLGELNAEKQHYKDMLPSSEHNENLREDNNKMKKELEGLKNMHHLLEEGDLKSKEYIIFFSNLLGFDLSPESINQSAFALFLQYMSGGKKISQSTISRLKTKEEKHKYSANEKKDATHLVKLLMNIPNNVHNKKPEALYKLIEDIYTLYDLSKTDFQDLSPEKKDQFGYLFRR